MPRAAAGAPQALRPAPLLLLSGRPRGLALSPLWGAQVRRGVRAVLGVKARRLTGIITTLSQLVCPRAVSRRSAAPAGARDLAPHRARCSRCHRRQRQRRSAARRRERQQPSTSTGAARGGRQRALPLPRVPDRHRAAPRRGGQPPRARCLGRKEGAADDVGARPLLVGGPGAASQPRRHANRVQGERWAGRAVTRPRGHAHSCARTVAPPWAPQVVLLDGASCMWEPGPNRALVVPGGAGDAAAPPAGKKQGRKKKKRGGAGKKGGNGVNGSGAEAAAAAAAQPPEALEVICAWGVPQSKVSPPSHRASFALLLPHQPCGKRPRTHSLTPCFFRSECGCSHVRARVRAAGPCRPPLPRRRQQLRAGAAARARGSWSSARWWCPCWRWTRGSTWRWWARAPRWAAGSPSRACG